MATIIQIKRTTTANLPSTLEQGEFAYLYDTSSTDTDAGGNGGRLYIGDPTSNTNTPLKVGGKYYTDLMDHAQGTLTASAALLVDSNKKIDNLKVDNLDLNGNSIISTDTNGDINITPNGTGSVVIDGLSHPQADGTAGQFLKTDGSGNLSFDTVTQTLSIAADTGTNDSVSTGETITFTGGEGIDTSVTNNQITIAAEDATSANKGVASFDATDFTVTSGAVTVNEERVEDIAGAMATNGTGITFAYDDGAGTLTTSLNNTAVTAGSYGSTTAIPTFTVDAQGRLTAAGTASISTTLQVGADSGTGNGVDLANDTLQITGGEGIDTSISGDTVTIAAEDATDTNKGVASFASADFAVSSGAVTIKSLGVSNAQLAGSITNAKLVNSSVVIGSDTVNLGDTLTDLNGITSLDVDNITVDGNVVSTTDTNGDLELSPNGTGTVIVPSGYESRAGFQSQSLVNKAYVDQVANGLDVKASVRVATTANLSATYNNSNGTLTANANGAISIDGVSLSLNDRVLVKDQTTQTQNGFYKVTTVGSGSAAYVLTRTPDANEASEITGGAFTFVEEGTNNADNGYVATHNGTPTLGTDNITFDQFSGAGQISAGDALSKTGNTIDVNVDDSSIEVASDALQVKALGITNAMLAGSIANAKLVNDSVTINGNSLALGGTLTLDTADFAENGNLFYTDERVDDRISNLFVAGEGIDLTYDDGANTFTVDAELATASNKGVASFHTDNFLVSTGVVTVTGIDGGTY
jgi:hypothetical protein